MHRAGGCATLELLRQHHSRGAVRAALADGAIVRLRRDRYALSGVEVHRREAHRMSATLSHLSAAAAYGWSLKTAPARPVVTVPRHRRLSAADQARAVVSWRDLAASDRSGGLTSPLRTVLDCAVSLPFDEALAVADSALREGDVEHRALVAAAAKLRGPGSVRARRVARMADGRAVNAFESVLRAIAMDVDAFHFVPQVQIWDSGLWATVDLADESARLVLEAEGFATHGTRAGLVRDCHRYTELIAWGWEVLRFTWEDVMFEPQWVRWAIQAVAERRRGDSVSPPPRRTT